MYRSRHSTRGGGNGEPPMGWKSGGPAVQYTTPELRKLGSFASLTLGVGGSCPDGGGRNNTQNSETSNSQGDECSEATNSG